MSRMKKEIGFQNRFFNLARESRLPLTPNMQSWDKKRINFLAFFEKQAYNGKLCARSSAG